MSEDLVKRARSVETGREGHLPPKQLVKELADRIEALAARVAKLEEALTWYAGVNMDTGEHARAALHDKPE